MEIPKYVLDGLETVRSSGLTNMLDRPTVIDIMFSLDYNDAASWLDLNKKEYMEALMQMGQLRKK